VKKPEKLFQVFVAARRPSVLGSAQGRRHQVAARVTLVQVGPTVMSHSEAVKCDEIIRLLGKHLILYIL
jgi:hypothetical protein